jgi:peroxiredoxin
MKQLKEISQNLGKFGAIPVLALTPEEPEAINQTKRKNGLLLKLIHDKNNDASRSLGIAFQLEPQVAEEYRALGIPVANPPVLPLASTFVLGSDLKVIYAFVNADYTQHAALPDVLRAVQSLKAPSSP